MIIVIAFIQCLIQNDVDIHSKSDNTDENIMNIMMLMLDHVCGTMMILLIILVFVLICYYYFSYSYYYYYYYRYHVHYYFLLLLQ
jgi:hypothetical protein